MSTYPEGDPFADDDGVPRCATCGAYLLESPLPGCAEPAEHAPTSWMAGARAFDGAPPVEGDPFAEPLHDPATGELLEAMTVTAQEVGQAFGIDATTGLPTEWTSLERLPQHMADDTAQAMVFPERGELQAFAGNLSRALDDRINALYNAAQAKRPAGPVTQAAIAGEVTTLAAISDLGKTLGGVFTRMDQAARSLLTDVLAELPRGAEVEKRGGSMSVRIGTRPDEDVQATLTQPTETFTDTPGIVDVLVPHLLSQDPGMADSLPVAAYAQGARDMAAVLLEQLLAAPKWKSTALDALRADLERSAEPGLAARLDAAYGRRPKGDPRATVERVAPAKRGGKPRTIDGPA